MAGKPYTGGYLPARDWRPNATKRYAKQYRDLPTLQFGEPSKPSTAVRNWDTPRAKLTIPRSNAAIAPTLSDARFKELVRRPCSDLHMPEEPSPLEVRPRVPTWPARAWLLQKKLLKAQNGVSAQIMNGRALFKLEEVIDLLAAAKVEELGVTFEVYDEGEAYGSGYGVDARIDFGPRPQLVKQLFERHSERSAMGAPWNCDPERMVLRTSDGRTSLKYAGALYFNVKGHLTHWFSEKRRRWHRLEERIRGAKGKRHEPAPDPPDTFKYISAALPRDPKTKELEVEFLAGKAFHLREPRMDQHPEGAATATLKHGVPSPTVQIAADARLDEYERYLGPDGYRVLIGAATGLQAREIGGGDAALGKLLVRGVLMKLLELDEQ
jgi:hypothetical protein